MFGQRACIPMIREHAEIFRNILRDLSLHRTLRPGGIYIPKDLDTESDIDELLRKYVLGDPDGEFMIDGFGIDGHEAVITFGNVSFMSGGGASLRYSVVGFSVDFLRENMVFMS